jgi:formate transporter
MRESEMEVVVDSIGHSQNDHLQKHDTTTNFKQGNPRLRNNSILGSSQQHHHSSHKKRPAHRAKDEHIKLFKNAQENFYAILTAGRRKCEWSMDKYIFHCFFAGMMIGIGGTAAINVSYNLPSDDKGIVLSAFGLVFPIGLLFILLLQLELWTGNTMIMLTSLACKQISPFSFCVSMICSWLGNWAGCVVFAWFIWEGCSLWHGNTVIIGKIQDIAVAKVTNHTFGQNVALAIPCNFLVNMAVFTYLMSEDVVSKIVGAYICIFTFVVSQFEHAIANMFLCSLSIFMGSPVDYWTFIWKNLIPVSIGNFIGGGFFVGLVLTFDYFVDKKLPEDLDIEPASIKVSNWAFINVIKRYLKSESVEEDRT